jgi:hypothetical protein
MREESCTFTRTGQNEYTLMIQGPKGNVLFFKRGMTYQEVLTEIENRMYLTAKQ